MYMSDCTFAMSDCISQMLETHFGEINMELFRIIKIQQDSLYTISRKNTQGVPEKLVNVLQSGY